MDLLWLNSSVKLNVGSIIWGGLLTEEGRSLLSEVQNIVFVVGGVSVSLWDESVNLLWLTSSVETFSFTFALSESLTLLRVESGSHWSVSVKNSSVVVISFWDEGMDLLWLLIGIKFSLSEVVLSVESSVRGSRLPCVSLNLFGRVLVPVVSSPCIIVILILLLSVESSSLSSKVKGGVSLVGGISVSLWEKSMDLFWLSTGIELSKSLVKISGFKVAFSFSIKGLTTCASNSGS